MDQAVNATQLAAPGSSLSLWGLFLQADIVVKLVILCLLAASIWVWAIIFEKKTSLRRANREANAFEDRFWSGGSLDDLYEHEGQKPSNPMAAVFGAAMGEWRRTARVAGADLGHTAVRERVDRAMNVTIQREMERMERWMIFLASIGSTAPFIGLFGTVWGIMHSFSAIAAMHNTNLSVVAPGIAEALFATAIGLVAAIPSVLAYNAISTDLSRFAARLEGFGTEFSAILSRQTEEGLIHGHGHCRRGPRARYRPLAEINVTPLVDVMLVLLIIFMVTAPLMTSGVTVDLPKTSANPVNTDSTPITISINAEGKVFVQNDQVEIGDLVSKLQDVTHGQTDRRIFVRGDQSISYGQIMQVMGTIVTGGFSKVALLAQQPNSPAPGATPAASPSSTTSGQ